MSCGQLLGQLVFGVVLQRHLGMVKDYETAASADNEEQWIVCVCKDA
jgi:hypothetical protein